MQSSAKGDANTLNVTTAGVELDWPLVIIRSTIWMWEVTSDFALSFLVCILTYSLTGIVEFVVDLLKVPKEETMYMARQAFLELDEQLFNLNEIFSYVNLVWCVRELIMFIFLIATVLQPTLTEETGLIESGKMAQPIVYCNAGSTAFNAVIRYAIFIRLHEKVSLIP